MSIWKRRSNTALGALGCLSLGALAATLSCAKTEPSTARTVLVPTAMRDASAPAEVVSAPSASPSTSRSSDPESSPEAQDGCAAYTGASTQELEMEVVKRARQTRRCYLQSIEDVGGFDAKVTVTLNVAEDGRVLHTSVSSTPPLPASMGMKGCVESAMAAPLPPPKGGCVRINVPLRFVQMSAPDASTVPMPTP